MAGPASLLSALDFFGKDDVDASVDKFKTVALRALHEQRIDDELRQAKRENERLVKENAALTAELKDLRTSFDTNVGDRERVLAFKAKRIEELNLKLRECEAINASLLQTLHGSAGESESSRDPTTSRAAMTALLQSGKPLFHALETCREQEYKRLYDDARAQCEQLTAQINANDALVLEMQAFERERADVAAQIASLHAQLAALAAQRDDAVHFLERKLVFEHDRLRREKDADVLACQQDMAMQMRTQMDITTQRTIDENVRVQLELRYQSAQVEKLIQQLDKVVAEKTHVQHEKRMLEDMTATLSKRVKFYEHVFAKMQQREQLARSSKHGDSGAPGAPHALQRIHSPRKPPLPTLDTPSSPKRQTICSPMSDRSAFACSSTLRLEVPHAQDNNDDDDASDEDTHDWRHAIVSRGEQLTSVTEALETHLQHRAFARKQVDAMLQHRLNQHQRQRDQLLRPRAPSSVDQQRGVFMGQAPLVKKKIVLSKASYAPSSYQRGRRMIEAPTTLDSFIRQHATISPRQGSGGGAAQSAAASSLPHSPNEARPRSDSALTALPGLAPLKPLVSLPHDRSEMWRPHAPSESPATARF